VMPSNLFNEGRDGITPIGDILPFRFIQREFYRRDQAFSLDLSGPGVKHPLMNLFEDAPNEKEGRIRFWQEMPPLDGINLVEAKRSAAVLLAAKADEVSWPVLMVSEVDQGRTLALVTDYAWKWYMGMVEQGKGNLAYLRFFHRMVRWLTRDPGLDPIRLILPEKPTFAGNETDVRLFVQEEDRQPLEKAVSVSDPDGVVIPSQIKSAAPGEALISFLPDKKGVYRIRVDATEGVFEEPLVVTVPSVYLDSAPDHGQLFRISETTGGEIVPPQKEDLLQSVERYAGNMEKRFIEEKRQSLWSNSYILGALLGFLSLEWYLRRRWGLL
jgi:hypothetical protein